MFLYLSHHESKCASCTGCAQRPYGAGRNAETRPSDRTGPDTCMLANARGCADRSADGETPSADVATGVETPSADPPTDVETPSADVATGVETPSADVPSIGLADPGGR